MTDRDKELLEADSKVHDDVWSAAMEAGDSRPWEKVAVAVQAAEMQRPFTERFAWRKLVMYKDWDMEPIETVYSDTLAVTRSNWGYRVMATPLAGCLDVDFSMAYRPSPQYRETLETLETWTSKAGQVWRVYQTAKGLRLLRIDAPQPLDGSYNDVAAAVHGVDPNYVDQCLKQHAFRMRVSPKPHRIGVNYPHWSLYGGWDYQCETPEKRIGAIKAYDQAASQYKVCGLPITVGGPDAIHPDLASAVELHDTLCRVHVADAKVETYRFDYWSDGGCDSHQEYHAIDAMALVALNHSYRQNGIAPDLLWNAFPETLRMRLRAIEGRAGLVMKEWDRQHALAQKWGETYPARPAAEELARLMDGAVKFDRTGNEYNEAQTSYGWYAPIFHNGVDKDPFSI
jgi:hypothetical protein